MTDRRKNILEQSELFVLDMDGTFYCGEQLIEGAPDFLKAVARAGKSFLFFTNNSSRAPEDYLAKLERLNCRISREQLITSADVAVHYLQQIHPGEAVYLIGTPALRKYFGEAGIRLTEDKPDVVMAAFDTTLTYEKLERGCTCIRQGAVFLATHPDINCPVEDGFVPDCGAICAAITLSTGKQPRYLGKPYRETVQMICDRTRVPLERIAFVGDRLYTDIAAGIQNGAAGLLVLTGETKPEDLAVSDICPDAVFESLGEMGQLL